MSGFICCRPRLAKHLDYMWTAFEITDVTSINAHAVTTWTVVKPILMLVNCHEHNGKQRLSFQGLLWIPQSSLFWFPVFSFLSRLPSPFFQLLSAGPRRVQGSISFNNFHIHDSHREWHPAGLDHHVRTQPKPLHSSLTLSVSGKLFFFSPGGRRQSNKSR